MPFDPRYAAAAIRRVSQSPDIHTVILGAGNATRLALDAAEEVDSHALRAVLDDDPARCGTCLSGIPVCSPLDYPVDDVRRVLITSEMFEAALLDRAAKIFDGKVEIVVTFDRASSLPSKLNEARIALGNLWTRPQADEALWYAADNLYVELRDRLNALPTWRYGPRRQIDEFRQIRAHLQDLVDWPHCRMLNFGCGRYHPIGLSLLALMLGAEQTCAMDLEPMLDPGRSASATADLLFAALLDPESALGAAAPRTSVLLQRLESVLDLPRLAAGHLQEAIRSSALEYRVESIYETSLPAQSMTLVVSRDVLEHLADVPAALRALHRLLRPDGVVLLIVDFSDHRRYENPARFAHWSHLRAPLGPTHLGTNRLRFPQLPPMFADAGLAIVRYVPLETEPLPSHVRPGLAPMYQQMSDDELAVVSAVAVLRRTR